MKQTHRNVRLVQLIVDFRKQNKKKVSKWRVLSAISTLMSDTNDGGYYGEPEPN